MSDIYPAHIRDIKDDSCQTVSEHCRGSALIASRIMSGLGLKNTCELAGLLHDMGKYTYNFKNILKRQRTDKMW